MMLSHSISQNGNSVTGAIDHTGTGFYGSNFHVGGNLIINAAAALDLPNRCQHSADLECNIKLLDDFIEVLQITAGALPNYRKLVDELHRLRTAVVAISKLGSNDSSQCRRSLAIRQAVGKLQSCIERFLRLSTQCGTRRRTCDVDWKPVLWGIQWAQYGNEEVEIFRAELEGHTSAIDTLLITLQISTGSPPLRKHLDHEGQHAVQQGTLIKAQGDIADNTALLHGLTQQQTDLIQSLIRTVQQQQAIIQQLHQIPPQVELRKPVILEDACGRVAPFHLDFINSREAFVAVLKVRFKDIGLQKIENGEFCFQERQRKREINLSRPWDAVFLPGQKVDMSMIFQRSYTPDAKCYGCGAFGEFSGNDLECPNCGLNCTRRIQDVEGGPPEGFTSRRTLQSVQSSSVLGKRKISSIVEPSIQDFRRVQVIELRRQLNAHHPRSNLNPEMRSQRAEAIWTKPLAGKWRQDFQRLARTSPNFACPYCTDNRIFFEQMALLEHVSALHKEHLQDFFKLYSPMDKNFQESPAQSASAWVERVPNPSSELPHPNFGQPMDQPLESSERQPRGSRVQGEAEEDAPEAADAATREPVTGLRSSERNAETNAEQVPEFSAHLTSQEQSFRDNESYGYPISQTDVADTNRRTGQTPGGRGSMFPDTTWNPEAIFRQRDKAFNVPMTNMDLTTPTKFPEPNTDETQAQTKRRRQEQIDTIKQDFKQRRGPDNHRNTSTEPIKTVNNNHLLVRSESSSEPSTIELSPMREVLENFSQLWDQLRQHQPPSTEIATPKTTSPRDAILDSQESEGGTPLFPLNASSNATSQDQTPDYHFEPPIIDPDAYAFDPFANQPPEYYTATPRGDNTLDYGEAGNLSPFALQSPDLVDFPILELEDGDIT